MLGWELFITRGQNDQSVASWLTGINGTNWLDELVSKGLAKDLGGNGYPNKYEANAGVLLSILTKEIPKHDGPLVIGDDYVQMPGDISNAKIDLETLRSLSPNEILTIEAWDQS